MTPKDPGCIVVPLCFNNTKESKHCSMCFEVSAALLCQRLTREISPTFHWQTACCGLLPVPVLCPETRPCRHMPTQLHEDGFSNKPVWLKCASSCLSLTNPPNKTVGRHRQAPQAATVNSDSQTAQRAESRSSAHVWLPCGMHGHAAPDHQRPLLVGQLKYPADLHA